MPSMPWGSGRSSKSSPPRESKEGNKLWRKEKRGRNREAQEESSQGYFAPQMSPHDRRSTIPESFQQTDLWRVPPDVLSSSYTTETHLGLQPELLNRLSVEALLAVASWNPQKLLQLDEGKFFQVMRANPSGLDWFSPHQVKNKLAEGDIRLIRQLAMTQPPPQETPVPRDPSYAKQPVSWIDDRNQESHDEDAEDALNQGSGIRRKPPPQAHHRQTRERQRRSTSAEPSQRVSNTSIRQHDELSTSPMGMRSYMDHQNYRSQRSEPHSRDAPQREFADVGDYTARPQVEPPPRRIEEVYKDLEKRVVRAVELEKENGDMKAEKDKVEAWITERIKLKFRDFDPGSMSVKTIYDAVVYYMEESCANSEGNLQLFRQEREKNTELEAKLVAATADVKDLSRDLERARKSHKEEMEKQAKGLKEQLESSERKLEQTCNDYERKLDMKDDEITKLKTNFDVRMAAHVADLQREITSLRGDLMNNSDDFRPSGDDILRFKYKTLKQIVHEVAFCLVSKTASRDGSRSNLNGHSGWDKGPKRKFFLQNIVWTQILQGFFSSPYGFGAFGPGDGKQILLQLFSAWERIFKTEPTRDAGFHNYRATIPDFEVFSRNREANKWRAATFQSIFMAAVPRSPKKGAPAPEKGIVAQFDDNRESVRQAIYDALAEYCDFVPVILEENITKIVELSSELALEFGSQRALVGLETVKPGTYVDKNSGFVDCEDGDMRVSEGFEAVLMVSPKLYRIGDGRNELKAEKVIQTGEAYQISQNGQ